MTATGPNKHRRGVYRARNQFQSWFPWLIPVLAVGGVVTAVVGWRSSSTPTYLAAILLIVAAVLLAMIRSGRSRWLALAAAVLIALILVLSPAVFSVPRPVDGETVDEVRIAGATGDTVVYLDQRSVSADVDGHPLQLEAGDRTVTPIRTHSDEIPVIVDEMSDGEGEDHRDTLTALAPDGTIRWTGKGEALAVFEDGTAVVRHVDPFRLEAIEPDGTVRWDVDGGEILAFPPGRADDWDFPVLPEHLVVTFDGPEGRGWGQVHPADGRFERFDTSLMPVETLSGESIAVGWTNWPKSDCGFVVVELSDTSIQESERPCPDADTPELETHPVLRADGGAVLVPYGEEIQEFDVTSGEVHEHSKRGRDLEITSAGILERRDGALHLSAASPDVDLRPIEVGAGDRVVTDSRSSTIVIRRDRAPNPYRRGGAFDYEGYDLRTGTRCFRVAGGAFEPDEIMPRDGCRALIGDRFVSTGD